MLLAPRAHRARSPGTPGRALLRSSARARRASCPCHRCCHRLRSGSADRGVRPGDSGSCTGSTLASHLSQSARKTVAEWNKWAKGSRTKGAGKCTEFGGPPPVVGLLAVVIATETDHLVVIPSHLRARYHACLPHKRGCDGCYYRRRRKGPRRPVVRETGAAISATRRRTKRTA